ncbi:hypothetical protein U9M48_016285 [Paspalum notatum var. saurae]|uniref:CASP-like protein n=1 Tax=Paspalum notatum var. saurae TaxID=547442 RepID=A0AAQ3WMX7_PASNO
MAMAVVATNNKSSSPAAYVAKPPPPPPWLQTTKDTGRGASTTGARRTSSSGIAAAELNQHHQRRQQAAVDGGTVVVVVLRAAAAVTAFVGVALVASCRHGDWMEFGRYPEYRYLLGASVVACVYSAAQAVRDIRRRIRVSYYDGSTATSAGGGLVDFAGDQVVAYLLMTASSAALPITLRMRSAVINVFTDAMVAAITLGFIAFAALALSAMISGFRLSAAAAASY